jgi:hypothetical protein
VSLIKKEYFRLNEAIDDLGLSGSDILYLAETGQLRLSVRVFGLMLERGVTEEIDVDDWQSYPEGTEPHSGLLELRERDAHEVLKTGGTEVHCFHALPGRYLCRPDNSSPFAVQTRDLLIRDTELQRLKALLGQQPAPSPAPASSDPCPGFVHSPDYRMVQIAGATFSLGVFQAAVVKILHHAALQGNPWCSGVAILAEIECSTLRMSDLFKSKRGWRTLIESNSRGMYRLAVIAGI